jgi:membrane protein
MSGSAGDTGRRHEQDRPRLSWRDRLGVLQRAVMRQPLVREALAVNDGYGAAGGGLLASGLSFSAIFALIPALLTIVAILGIVIDDAARRTEIVDSLIQAFPPLEPIARAIVDGMANSARVGTIVGIVGLIWGASAFYGALDGALSRLFPGRRPRDVVQQRIRGVLGVFLLVGMAVVVVGVTTVLGVVVSLIDVPSIDLYQWSLVLLTVVMSVIVAFALYVVVPRDGPSWRAAVLPSLVAGVLIGLLTGLFNLIAPYLIRGFSGLGILASMFAALIWFNFVFQILLYSAAWARIKRDRERAVREPPRI